MDWTLIDIIYVVVIIAINILILITYFEARYFSMKRKVSKINETLEEHFQKLKEIESKLVHKIEKEMVEKEKNREQKLLKLKNEIDEMLREVSK